MARVNLDMTKEERIRYLDWMREMSRKHGVRPERSVFRIEEEDLER